MKTNYKLHFQTLKVFGVEMFSYQKVIYLVNYSYQPYSVTKVNTNHHRLIIHSKTGENFDRKFSGQYLVEFSKSHQQPKIRSIESRYLGVLTLLILQNYNR